MATINDPVHGHIYINQLEELLINTREMARLRGIQQLGLADLTYPGANHTRFEHGVGTLFIADKIARYLGLSDSEVKMVRAAALLHDVGHSAYSHVVEGVLSRNPRYQPLIDGRRFIKHEMFTRYMIVNLLPKYEKISTYVAKCFGDPGVFFEDIARMATGEVDRLSKPYLGQIISDDIDADRIDFLLRDSYHTGVSLGLVDLDQIVQSLSLSQDRIVLGGNPGPDESYDEDMALTAAESMLIARSHHYSAIIHNPRTQASRVMLLHALENALARAEENLDITSTIIQFFTIYNDNDLLNFISKYGDDSALALIQRLRNGDICDSIARFNHKSLAPKTRMALSTIARHGAAKKMFEGELMNRFARLYGASVLIDLDVASGIPKSTRVRIAGDEGFLYDESALANGLVRAISRQISLCVFSKTGGKDVPAATSDMLKRIEELSPELLRFIRNENYLPVEGLLLIFYCLFKLFSEEKEGMIKLPRIRNITWLYQTVRQLGEQERLKNLFDYQFHRRYGFYYSDKLFEDIQILVAMGMIDEDLRYYEKNKRLRQRYEYVLTSDGLDYASEIAKSYEGEVKGIKEYLTLNKHSIPRDMVITPIKRFKGEV